MVVVLIEPPSHGRPQWRLIGATMEALTAAYHRGVPIAAQPASVDWLLLRRPAALQALLGRALFVVRGVAVQLVAVTDVLVLARPAHALGKMRWEA